MSARSSFPIVLALVLGALPLAVSLGRAHAGDEPAAAAPAKADRLADLAWLAGHWQGKGPDGGATDVTYTDPRGGVILSTTKSLDARGAVVFFELEEFHVEGKDVLEVPYPMGRRAAPFKLTAIDAKARTARFENPKNGFPSRIDYAARGDDELVITCTGEEEGKAVEMKLVLERCAR